MKKPIFYFVVVTLIASLLWVADPTFASEADYDWDDNGDGTATITEYKGSDTNVVIPGVLHGLRITKIDKGDKSWSPFRYPETVSQPLESVTFPEHLTYIGKSAFWGNDLTELDLPEGLIEIESTAFRDNELTNVIIPESVTKIGANAFQGNKLKSINIPSSMTEIERGLFTDNEFEQFDIPNHVVIIKAFAFMENELARLTIPNSVTRIEERAFSFNELKSVIFPESVAYIGTLSFSYNGDLSEVIILNKDVKIENNALFNTSSDLIIYGFLDSTAEDYANHNGHTFVALDSFPHVDVLFDNKPVYGVLSVDYQASGVIEAVYGFDDPGLDEKVKFDHVSWTVDGRPAGTGNLLELDAHTDDIGIKQVVLTIETEYGVEVFKQFELEIKPPAPAMPNLVIDEGSESSILLRWNAIPHAEKYILKRDGAEIFRGHATSYEDHSLNLYTSAVYTLVAKNKSGTSDAAKVTYTPHAPIKPQNLTASAGNRFVTLNWEMVTGATFYQVYMSTESNKYTPTPTVTVTDATYQIDGLHNGTTYYFVVQAGNEGGVSGGSNEASATPATVPATPVDVTAVAHNGSATVSFLAPLDDGGSAIIEYDVLDMAGNVVATGKESPIIITGLTNGTSYTFTVQAKNAVGSSGLSVPSNTVTPSAPSSSGSSTPSSTSSVTDLTDSGVDVLVNGKSESAGIARTDKINNQQVTRVTVDEKKIQQRLDMEGMNSTITIPFSTDSDVVSGGLNGRMVKNMENLEAMIEIRTGHATYTLPAKQINIDAISVQLGANIELQDIMVNVEIGSLQSDDIQIVENVAASHGLTIMVPPLNFKVSAVYEGRTEVVTKFNAYVERTIAIPTDVDPHKITTGVVMEEDGNVRHVPTKVVELNGVYYAQINSLTNSTYTVVWNPVAFKDVAGHWAREAVNNMGSRMIVYGLGNNMFAPNRNMTRAEFAATVIRSLGLAPEEGDSHFTDIKRDDWFHGYINTSSSYQLIAGFADGTFRPHEHITREQAMTIIAKAMEMTQLSDQLPNTPSGMILLPYEDAAEVSLWALKGVADSVQAGIVTGRSDTALASKEYITRAEVAAIIERLLQRSNLI